MMYIREKVSLVAKGLKPDGKFTNDEIAVICGKLIKAESELETLKKSEQELRMQYISDFGQDQQCYEENAKLKAELEAIKKQKPAITLTPSTGDLYRAYWHNDWKLMAGSKDFYYRPVYQHSFTIDGHTFYADNEVDILYLERKFGVGGKTKLEMVKGD